MKNNLIKNHDFTNTSQISVDNWTQEYPDESLKPVFISQIGALSITGNGSKYSFGYWKQTVKLDGGFAYRFTVMFTVRNIDDINLNILNMICWLKGEKADASCPHDHISSYSIKNGYIVGKGVFKVPHGIEKAEIQLGFRYSSRGKVTWHNVELFKDKVETSRYLNVSVMKYNPLISIDQKTNLKNLGKLLDNAGALESDLVLLPEFSNLYCSKLSFRDAAESIPDGPTCSISIEKAKQYSMNVCCTIIEKIDKHIFNTAVIFDRYGNTIGKYSKTHPYWPEVIFEGECPGNSFPVFNLDIGRIGIMICYDAWYAETARLLGLKGAELILFPNAGYEPLLMPARAIDNRLYVAVSSINDPAMIVDTWGNILSKTTNGLTFNSIDLNRRPASHPNSGGTLNCNAAGRRSARNSISHKLYEEILEEMKTWENRPEHFS